MVADSSQGVCHGFEIFSSINHRFLHPGHGERVVVEEVGQRRHSVGEPIIHFPAREGRLSISILATGDETYEVLTESSGIFEVDVGTRRIGVPRGVDPMRREMLTFGTPAALLISASGDVAFHGGAIGLDEKAVIVSGPGGSGKSTLTAAALAHGWVSLSDDLCRLRVGDLPSVYPGPKVVRLREGALSILDRGFFTIAGKVADKTQAVPPDRAEPSMPLAAIAFITRVDDESSPSVTPLSPEQALPMFWKQAFYLPDEASREVCFAALATLVDLVPAFRFAYPHRPQALDESLAVLASLRSTANA